MPVWSVKEKNMFERLLNSVVIKPEWKAVAYKDAHRIIANKSIYQEVSDACEGNVPWEFIGVIHLLESGCNFKRHLHNGDPLTARTVLVPAGRPIEGKPPFSFLTSAVDALEMKGFHEITDWSPARMCYELERYNGFGYRKKGFPLSPYLWSGTNHYNKGKYVRDGVYDANAISRQLGCVPVLETIWKLESEKFEDTIPVHESRRVRFTKYFDDFIKFSGLAGLVSFNFITEIKSFVNDNAGLILAGTGATVWLAIKYIQFMSNREYKEGRLITSGSAEAHFSGETSQEEIQDA